MTPERWQQIQDVLEKALELASEQRSAYLNQACSSDPSLRQEVETLLASSDGVRSSFLQPSPSTQRVSLTSGTKLGEYEVKSMLGSGGMGEVYRARDSRLGRDVAIKVLPSSLSADSERLRRFEQEARAAAALNHPNILAVFQMGTYEGAPYLVSELLEGETLREQIKRGRLSLRKAIDYAMQIARGLAAAHEKGIVHRDLKPENLFVTKDGRVKILDFGLAKLTQPQSSSEHSSPTLTEETEAGVVMGTAGYMAPEQVRGQKADNRADIFAFGTILYEMLAGKRAFQKPTSAETMTAILNEDPPGISQIAKDVSSAMQRVVQRCLEKNPEQRFQSASDLAFALDALSDASGSGAAAFSNKDSWKISKLWAVAALLVIGVAAVLVVRFRSPRVPEPKHELVEKQLTANPPENRINSSTLSRDGKYLAYSDSLSKNLYLLAIDSGEIREVPLPGDYAPLDWFPDGNHLLMSGHGNDLWKMSTWDFSLRKLWGGRAGYVAVSPDGSRIAFMKDRELWLMGGDGEEPHQVPIGDADGLSSLAWSPSGQRLAYIRLRGTWAKPDFTIETCDLAGGTRTVVLSDPGLFSVNGGGASGIAWLPDGRLLYSITSGTNESNLWARFANPGSGQPRGDDATRLAGWKNFEASYPQASADGKRLLVTRNHVENSIYIGDLAIANKTFTPHRLTEDDWFNLATDWTKDSKAIVFSSKRNGKWAILKQNVDGKTPVTLITGSEHYLWPKMTAQGIVLYTAAASPNLKDRAASARLMSTSERGGARITLMNGGYRDNYYACGSSPSSSCVVSELKNGHLIFFHLDPLKGKGEELARIDGYQSPDATWDLSSDGARIAIVDPTIEGKGEIRILNLADRRVTVLPVRNWKWDEATLVSWAAAGKSWFVYALSQHSPDALVSVDANGNLRVLQEIPAGIIVSIVPSPDGKRLAFTKRMFVDDMMLLENF